MYQRVLVPLDGSSRAESILPHVQALAACLGAEVLLLHVITPPMMMVGPYDMLPVDDGEIAAEQRAAAETYLDGWCERLAADDIAARRLVEAGGVVPTIIDVAEREGADLVAMASHGRSGLARAFYGSVAAGVLQRIDRPLLLIRA